MVDVVVVDDSWFTRIQIRDILEERELTVVAEAGNGKRAVEAVIEHEPDVVTMDVETPTDTPSTLVVARGTAGRRVDPRGAAGDDRPPGAGRPAHARKVYRTVRRQARRPL